MDDFAAFILSHGRPSNLKTYKALKNGGYTGRIVIVVDDMDATLDEYVKRYGDEVVVFDKAAAAEATDTCDNFNRMNVVVYARNTCHQIARDLGIKHFIVLDDDYFWFEYRFNDRLEFVTRGKIRSMDLVFKAMLDFYRSTPALTLTMAQGGDFIGGKDSQNAKKLRLSRKAMNSFICSVDRPFSFIGTINEDANTYVNRAVQGDLMFTLNQVSLCQEDTQTNKGGLTEHYLEIGTYVKSFYSVMIQPSCVRVQAMGDTRLRLHHRVDWKKTAPMIVHESTRKKTKRPRP